MYSRKWRILVQEIKQWLAPFIVAVLVRLANRTTPRKCKLYWMDFGPNVLSESTEYISYRYKEKCNEYSYTLHF